LRRTIALAGLLAVFGVGALAIKIVGQQQFSGASPANIRLPDIQLVDDRNDPFTFGRLRGTAYALFFGYTHCPDTCPITLAKIERARLSLPPQNQQATTIVFVTVDPSRDTPAELHRYRALFGAGLVGVTGTQQALHALYSTLHVWSVRIGKGPNYEMAHTSTIFFVDRGGNVRAIRDWQDGPQALARDFKELTQ
jgi:protein SCO1